MLSRNIIFMLILIAFIAGCAHLGKKSGPVTLETDKKAKPVYEWVKNLQLDNGLLESSDNSNFVSLYENALAVMVFSAAGDFNRAEKVLDFFDGHIGELEEAPGGFGQFRDRNGIPSNGKPNRWLGDNAWLLIAINNYHQLAGNDKYAKLEAALEKWIRSLQASDGGLESGYGSEGQKLWRSTEGTIDAFNAVKGYDDFHKRILSYLKAAGYWDAQKKTLLAWKENPKYKYALDLHSWGYCALPGMPVETVNGADMYLTTKKATANGKKIKGYCFDLDLDTIWLEGTGEMVIAYQSAGEGSKADFYISQLEKMIIPSAKDPALAGIPYATNQGTHYGTGKLWEGVDTNPSLASSTWYLLGKMRYDPMKIGREKNIPEGDMFIK